MNIRGLVFRDNYQQLVNEISCQTIDYLDDLGQRRRLSSYVPKRNISPTKQNKCDVHRNGFKKPNEASRNKMTHLNTNFTKRLIPSGDL